MSLRAKAPEVVKPSKPKLLLSGAPGVGKTFFAMGFEKPFFVDVEGGGSRPQYMDRLKKAGGAYMGKEEGSQDFKTVIEQFKELATTKHDFKSVCVDSFSKLYNLTAAIAEEKVGNVYGADKKEAQKPTRQLQLWMDRLDLPVILICHSKSEWKNGAATGQSTYDGYDKLSYDLDLWLEAILIGQRRTMLVRKSRIDSFIMGNSYPLEYQTFVDLYGKDVMEKPLEQVVLATKEQVDEAKHLIGVFNISEDDQKKALKKYDVEKYEELTSKEIDSIITNLKSKLTKETK